VLFDLGHNQQQNQESPLEQNLQRLDVNTDELDTVFSVISIVIILVGVHGKKKAV